MTDSRLTRRSLIAAATIGSFASVIPARAAAPIALRLSSSLPANANSAHWIWYDRFVKSLKDKVGDAIEIQYFPDNQLGKEADIVGSVKLGVVDMMISGSSIWSTVAPEVGVLDLGYLFPSMDATGKILDGAAGAQLNKLFADKAGVEVIAWGYSLGGRNVTAREPARNPGELKGRKIRVLPVANFVATLKAMGASPAPMSLGEVYTALQTGVLDGMEHDAPTVLALKAYEVAKNISLTQHIYNPQTVVIGRRAIAKLPADLQAPFRAAAIEAATYQRSRANDIEATAFQTLKSNGVTVYEADRDAFRSLVTPIWADFAKNYPGAKPILDAIVQG